MSEIKPVSSIKPWQERLQGAFYGHDEEIQCRDAETLELRAENESQAKRIAELEAATEHLGLTPQQAKDGLARHKAQVAEIESLRKQVEGIAKGIQKHFGLSDSDLTLLMSNFENGDSK